MHKANYKAFQYALEKHLSGLPPDSLAGQVCPVANPSAGTLAARFLRRLSLLTLYKVYTKKIIFNGERKLVLSELNDFT
jgi:hypothetical protein